MSTNRTSKPLIRLAATALGMLAFVGLATACEPPGCAKDCVTSVVVNPGTTQTAVTLTDKAKVNVTIYNEASRINAVVSKSSTSYLTKHVVTHGSITPDRTYWYTVSATDQAGKTWKEQGTFRAQKRTLNVTVTRIKLVDDSDSTGTGEIRFGMKVNATDFGQIYADGDMGSGKDQKGLMISRVIPNKVGSTFTVSVEGQDDDCEGIGSLCDSGGAFDYGNGSNDDYDWATATSATTGVPATNGSGSWSATTSGHALKFEVYGTWSITYSAS